MLFRKIVLFLILAMGMPLLFCQAKNSESVSGKIVTGYRVLPLDPSSGNVNYTVFRGDYIKFKYLESFGPLPFNMAAFKYQGDLLPNPDKSPYFKMKKTGIYPFTIGDVRGEIEVIELVRPNYTEVSAHQAEEILKNVNPFILDVRTPGEYKQLYINGANLIPVQELQARVGELSTRKHEDIFIYCATGNRSTVASKILADQGFKRIYNLRYGIYDWARKGFPYSGASK